MMLIRFQAPNPWWSRGLQLLWLLPEARVERNPWRWDLSVQVYTDAGGLQLAVEAEDFQGEAFSLAEPREFSRALFQLLSQYQGRPLSAWGLLTGMRPGKIGARLIHEHGVEATPAKLGQDWLLRRDKAELLVRAVANGQPLLQDKGLSLYVSVPFCPSRCHYCSFASLPLAAWRSKLGAYVRQGAAELEELLRACRSQGHAVNSIYVGGGTPTTLSPDQLYQLLEAARGWEVEFTVEAGRPDTLTEEHLAVFRKLGVTRISVNSQYPRDETLRAIGRRHSAQEFYQALDLAVGAGLGTVNSDLIIGLPGQNPEEFARVVSRLAAAGATNITIHALALKRGAELREQYLAPVAAAAIAPVVYQCLDSLGYQPYYLYRQRNIASDLENVGFGRPGHFCYYNIASIAESEPVLGVGAGALSKLDRASGILVNPRDVNQYLARWEELLQRKLSWLEAGRE